MALPIGLGLVIHEQFPKLSIIAPIVAGILFFAALFCIAEGIWRTLRATLTGGKTDRVLWWLPSKGGYSDTDKFFMLTMKPYIIPKTRFSKIEREWPHTSENPLFAKAFDLLRECAEKNGSFNQAKLKQARPAIEKVRALVNQQEF